jgi:hypothetical protein
MVEISKPLLYSSFGILMVTQGLNELRVGENGIASKTWLIEWQKIKKTISITAGFH